jgi:purine-binding chemotaxis protein CheW
LAASGNAQFITFFVGEDRFAAVATSVSEVFRGTRITRVPGGPHSLLGVAALRGTAAPIISLARLLGRDEKPGPEQRFLLLNGDQAIGLAVDRLGAMASLPAPPADTRRAGAGMGGLYAFEDGTLRLLDIDALLKRDFAQAMAGRKAGLAPDEAAVPAPAAEALLAFLGFDLAGQAYGLPLETVSEVIKLPPHMASIAQSDDAVLGVAELRGRLLPVVSLRHLLGLGGVHDAAARVVVTRIGDALIGLAVDRLRHVVRVGASALDAAPAVLNRGAGEAQVQTICRVPDEAGLIAILSGERLFRDSKMAQILADGAGGGDMAEGERGATLERYLIFSVGGEEYGLPLAAVNEIVRLPERLNRVPNAPAFIKGVLNLRGSVVTVIDQRSRFNVEAASAAGKPRIIVTTIEGRQAGFIVDAVSELLALAGDQIEMTPRFTADAGRIFTRIATLNGGDRLILLIEPTELLARAERDLLAGFTASAAEPAR